MDDRFVLQKGRNPNTWVVTDTSNGIVVTFREHAFNDTQEATLLDDCNASVEELAKAMRELGDWMAKNHYDLIF